MTPKPRIIYNPTAGKGSAAKNLPLVQSLLSAHGFDYDLLLTERPGHAQQAARQAAEAGCQLVVAAGGDGTANETLNGLMLADVDSQSRPTLGVLPIGRGNDFAYGVDIPTQLQPAVEVLVQGNRRTIDVGRVTGGDFPQGRFFGNGVGLGFDTVVGFEAAKIRWLRGAASYLAALVRTIFLYSRAPVYEICLDGGVPVRQPFLMVSIMNGTRMGGTFHMAPESDPGDGLFDLCQVGQVPQIKIIVVAAKFINGTQKEHPAVRMQRARQVTIHAIQGAIPAHADGETICTSGSSLSIEMFPAALAVVSKNHAG